MDGLFWFDINVFRAIHEGWRNPFLDGFFWIISDSGYGHWQVLLILLFCSGLFLKLKITKRISGREKWFWPLIWSFAASGILNALFKKFVYRERPTFFDWVEPLERLRNTSSFGSGHTATSFGIAACIWVLSRDTKLHWWGPLSMIWASLVGIARVYRGVHWPTDVLAGALIGLMCGVYIGTYVLTREEKTQAEMLPEDMQPEDISQEEERSVF